MSILALLNAAAVELPSVFGDHMLLQRDCAIRVWGKGRPGEKITVEFKGRSAGSIAGEDGKWAVELPACPASSEGAVLTVQGDHKLTFSDVLVGDVWLCAGQSNMEFELKRIVGADEIIGKAKKHTIRLFNIPHVWSRVPEFTVKAGWQTCSPESAASFSAVAYLTGTGIAEKADVPVGLVSIAWGGARIEAMCAAESFREASLEPAITQAFENGIRDYGKQQDCELRWDKQRLPSVIFNAMVHPITPYAVRGLLWYQGEDNHDEGMAYAEKLRGLAWTWRTYFQDAHMPIFVVQLPPWNYHGDIPDLLPRFWQAQYSFVERDPNAGIVITTDCGDSADIHPTDKVPLAKRLTNLVLYKEYGIGDDSALSPAVRFAERRDNIVHIELDHPNGLVSSQI